MYDLRFLGDSARIIQSFQPSCFSALDDVSVSGIDVSKDRKELLVSYESDQIYTFPLFPSHITDPTTDDMISYSNNVINNFHFGAYGAHLNRFTFLKCAKYAGPNDEYICTGSVSLSCHKIATCEILGSNLFIPFRILAMLLFTKRTQDLLYPCSKPISLHVMELCLIRLYRSFLLMG